jgi:hypothetical protein
VVIRPASWIRALLGMGFLGGLLILLVGLASLGNDLGLAIYGIAAGPLLVLSTVLGLRISVRVDEKGVRVRAPRTVFIPVSEIDHLTVVPRQGGLGLSGGMLAVVRSNGTMVKLEATGAVRMSQAAAAARLHALTEQLTSVLGLRSADQRAHVDHNKLT